MSVRYQIVAAAFLAGGLTLAANAEDTVRGLSCTFTQGSVGSYDAGAYKSRDPSPLAFDISDIDLERQSARLSIAPVPGANAPVEPGPLRIIRALNANHFLEVANEGFLNLTTVYDADPASGKRPAIHSRHLGLFGQPVFAQYAGFCVGN